MSIDIFKCGYACLFSMDGQTAESIVTKFWYDIPHMWEYIFIQHSGVLSHHSGVPGPAGPQPWALKTLYPKPLIQEKSLLKKLQRVLNKYQPMLSRNSLVIYYKCE